MARQTVATMWPVDCEGEDEGCAEGASMYTGCVVFVGMRMAMVLGAALLAWARVDTSLQYS